MCFIHSQAALFMNEHTYYVTHRRQRVFLYRPRGRTLDYAFLAGYARARCAPRGPIAHPSARAASFGRGISLGSDAGRPIVSSASAYASRRMPRASIAITDSLPIDSRRSRSVLEQSFDRSRPPMREHGLIGLVSHSRESIGSTRRVATVRRFFRIHSDR